MRSFLNIIMAVALVTICQYGHAAGGNTDDTPAVKVLESGKKTKKLEGATLKIARPILKKTPMSVIMDDIRMLMICPLDNQKKDQPEMAAKVERMLKSYTMVREIDDELYHMYIYIDTPHNDRFSELILYHKRPEVSIMLFEGDFTTESLLKVGELSDQQREKRRQSKK